MRLSNLLTGAAALAFLAGPALADLTAEDVWADWQRMVREQGGELTATLERALGRIVLRDLTIPTAAKDGRITLPEVTLAEEGGEVAVLVPAQTIRIAHTTPDGKRGVADARFTPRDLTYRLSGTPEAMSFTQAAKSLSIECENVLMDGKPVEDPTLACSFHVAGLDRQGRVLTQGDRRETTQSLKAGRLAGSFSFGPKGEEAVFGMGATLDDLAATSQVVTPTAWADMTELLRETEQEGTTTYGALDASTNRLDQRISLRAAGGETAGDLRDGRVDVRSRLNGGVVAFSALGLDEAPGMDFGTLAVDLAGPIVQTEAAQPLKLFLDMSEVRLHDAAWALFDPEAVLPRDPGQLTLDLSGLMRVTGDLAAPAGTTTPLEVETLDVNAFALALAGAKLSGTGAFTFPDGTAQPVGTADLLLAGGERLLDGPVRIGIVPPGQAMVVRMMAGGFATPGDGPDTLKTRVEFRADGSILANGRPVR